MSKMKIKPLIEAEAIIERDQLLLHLQQTSYNLVAALDEKIQRLEARIKVLEDGDPRQTSA